MINVAYIVCMYNVYHIVVLNDDLYEISFFFHV